MAVQSKREKSKKRTNWGPIMGGVVLALVVMAYFFSQRKSVSPSQKNESSTIASYSPIKACHVFIENSGSMDGYVQSVNSQLKSDLNALVSNIQPLCDTLTLNYINSQVIPISSHQRTSDFFEGLSVSSFKRAGGNRSNTSLRELLNTVYERTAENEVSILVSDMILDLKSGQSPESVSTNIETDLREKLMKRPNWSVVVWRMLSDYEGNYYHRSGSVQLRNVKRPYYICFFGDRGQLRSILEEKQLPDNMPLWKNRVQSLSLEPVYKDLSYYLVPRASLGTIRLDVNDQQSHTIENAESGTSPDGKSGLGFDLVLKQRPRVLQSLEDLMSPNNYDVKPSAYRVVRIQKQGEGLRIRLEASNVLRGDISVLYLQAMPTWFTLAHCEQNDNIYEGGAIEQTYGIRYILEGLCRPYETQAKQLFKMSIHIN